MPREERNVGIFQFEPGDRTITETIVMSVASALDVDPVDLPPLQRTIDTDALDRLLAGNRHKDGLSNLSFEYSRCLVTIEGPDQVIVSLLE